MNRLLIVALVAVTGCSKPRADSTATARPTNESAAPAARSANAPDRASIPEGSGWSCTVEDVDGGLRDDTCKRSAEACAALLAQLESSRASIEELERRLGVHRPPTRPMRCMNVESAHCITYTDTNDAQVHWDCSRTPQRCQLRRQYFTEENQRGGSVVRYRSISDCEEIR